MPPLRKSHARRRTLHPCTTLLRRLRYLMTAVANTLCRLAPRTSARQCAHSAQNSSNTTSNCIPKTPDRRSRCHRLIGFHNQRRKIDSQNNSPKYQMLFNIHNPN
jgi:hypothetical protein